LKGPGYTEGIISKKTFFGIFLNWETDEKQRFLVASNRIQAPLQKTKATTKTKQEEKTDKKQRKTTKQTTATKPVIYLNLTGELFL